jgi:hypothetical protein
MEGSEMADGMELLALADRIERLMAADHVDRDEADGILVTHADEIVAALRAYAWRPFETVPDGEHVLLNFKYGERGIGGMETATVYNDDGRISYWTHGGPNSGIDIDWQNNEQPTHWRPLGDPPT